MRGLAWDWSAGSRWSFLGTEGSWLGEWVKMTISLMHLILVLFFVVHRLPWFSVVEIGGVLGVPREQCW